jgi:hypothetical protein
MFSPSRGIRAVALLFVSCLSGTVAFPQAVNFIRHAADPLPLANLPAGRAPCTRNSGSGVRGPYAAGPASGGLSSPCDTVPVSVTSVKPCSLSSLAQFGCNAPGDPVPGDLAAMGRTGQIILRARERVLEILQTENACSGWFREKDSNPAATFRTLTFEVDPQGQEFVQESNGVGGTRIFRSPYVARVIQADGSYATITINPKGAFFLQWPWWSKRKATVDLEGCAAYAYWAWGPMREKRCTRRSLPYCTNLAIWLISCRRMKETRMESRYGTRAKSSVSAARKSNPKSGEIRCRPCVSGDCLIRALWAPRTGPNGYFPVDLHNGEQRSDSPAIEKKKIRAAA